MNDVALRVENLAKVFQMGHHLAYHRFTEFIENMAKNLADGDRARRPDGSARSLVLDMRTTEHEVAVEIIGLNKWFGKFHVLRDVVRRAALTRRCESVKRALSTAVEAPLSMREAYVEGGEARDLGLIIERSWVDPLWDPLFARATAEIVRVLGQAGWAPSDVDQVALIGGSALVPRYQDHVRRVFPRPVVTVADNAHVAVATGATLLAARHQPGTGEVPVLNDLRPLR